MATTHRFILLCNIVVLSTLTSANPAIYRVRNAPHTSRTPTTTQNDGRVLVNQASLEKAMAMMQDNDDWMNTLKLMMTNGTSRFKIETRRVVEYGDTPPEEEENWDAGEHDKGGMMLTMIEDVMPVSVSPSKDPNQSRIIGGLTNTRQSKQPDTILPIFVNGPRAVKASEIVVGDVGLCKTQYTVELIDSALLMRAPEAPKATLAHPIPATIGRCRFSNPPNGSGSLKGKCVLAAQAHIAWILVPEKEAKDFDNCMEIKGVSSLRKCSDWIVVGGRCVFETEM